MCDAVGLNIRWIENMRDKLYTLSVATLTLACEACLVRVLEMVKNVLKHKLNIFSIKYNILKNRLCIYMDLWAYIHK